MHECPAGDRTTPDKTEEIARTVLEPHLGGRLVVWDDNSEPMMWDFCLVGEDGDHLASVEITRSTDQALKEFDIRLDKTGDVWDAPQGLEDCWTVILHKDVSPFKVDRATLDELLLLGQEAGGQWLTSDSPRPLRDLVNQIGLVGALPRHTCDNGPSIHIDLMNQYVTGGNHVSQSLITEAGNNEEKLKAAIPPRHLLIWIEKEDLGAALEVAEKAAPGEPVVLPDFVEVGWAAAGYGDNVALWRAEQGQPWTVIQPYRQ